MNSLVSEILRFTGYGAAAGFLYGGVRASLENYEIIALEPNPEAFQIDAAATDIFSRLHKFRKVSDKAEQLYVELLRAVDRLLFLELSLLRGTKPRLDDSLLASSYAVAIKPLQKKLKREVLEKSKELKGKGIPPLEELDSLLGEVWELVLKHVNFIGGQTDHITADSFALEQEEEKEQTQQTEKDEEKEEEEEEEKKD